MKITFAARQKHPVFAICCCRSEIKTSDLWDYCVTERGTTGTNVPEHSNHLSKSPDLHHWIIPHKNMRISSTCEGDLNHRLRIEKWFVFLLGFGFFLSPDQRSETWSQLQVRFLPENSINTLISCCFHLRFYVGSFCIQNLDDLCISYLHFIDNFLDLCWLEGSDWLRTSPAVQGSAQVSIPDPSLDMVFSGGSQDPWLQLHFYTG